jgi:hypothetical protein
VGSGVLFGSSNTLVRVADAIGIEVGGSVWVGIVVDVWVCVGTSVLVGVGVLVGVSVGVGVEEGVYVSVGEGVSEGRKVTVRLGCKFAVGIGVLTIETRVRPTEAWTSAGKVAANGVAAGVEPQALTNSIPSMAMTATAILTRTVPRDSHQSCLPDAAQGSQQQHP